MHAAATQQKIVATLSLVVARVFIQYSNNANITVSHEIVVYHNSWKPFYAF